MLKFKKGDKVVALVDMGVVKKGMVGTVLEDNSSVPYVEWQGLTTGYDGPYNDDRRSCLALKQDEMELLKLSFNIGDRVMMVNRDFTECYKLPVGARGTIVDLYGRSSYVVRFDNWHKGHNGDIDSIKDASCLFCLEEDLIKEPKEPKLNIVLFRQGNKVIAKLTEGKRVINTTEAKCSPEDPFNFFVGSQIALQRLMAEEVDYEDIIYPVPETTGVSEFLLY